MILTTDSFAPTCGHIPNSMGGPVCHNRAEMFLWRPAGRGGKEGWIFPYCKDCEWKPASPLNYGGIHVTREAYDDQCRSGKLTKLGQVIA